jgi:hypothetical protein
MQLPVKYLELGIVYKEASRNLKFTVRDIEDTKIFKNHCVYTESTGVIFKGLQKIIHLVTHTHTHTLNFYVSPNNCS